MSQNDKPNSKSKRKRKQKEKKEEEKQAPASGSSLSETLKHGIAPLVLDLFIFK